MADKTPNGLPRTKILTVWPSDRKPRAKDILTLKKEVRESLQAFHTTRGGGANGHVALMMTNATYLLISNGNAFAVASWSTQEPGDAPMHAPNAQPHMIHKTNHQYKVDLRDFNLYHYVQVTVKGQILQAVPNRFTLILEDTKNGYSKVTIRQLTTHLISTYGTITDAALMANFNKLDQEWDPDTGIEMLIGNYQKIQQFAALVNPISNKMLQLKALEAVKKTGLFTTDIATFKHQEQDEQTWTNWQKDFIKANTIRRDEETTESAGYHSTNAAKNNATKTANKDNTTKTTETPEGTPAGYFYCWTHGLMHTNMRKPEHAHTSATCAYLAQGHNTKATLAHMQGSNMNIRCIPKEPAIFEHTTYKKEENNDGPKGKRKHGKKQRKKDDITMEEEK